MPMNLGDAVNKKGRVLRVVAVWKRVDAEFGEIEFVELKGFHTGDRWLMRSDDLREKLFGIEHMKEIL